MTRRGLWGAALLVLAGGAGIPQPARAQRDSSARADTTRRDSTARDSTARKDTTARDTTPAYLPVFAASVPAGPLPRGTRFSFTADSFAFSNIQTLSDLLSHIPGVYVARGGIYGQAEIGLYGGRGASGLEVYWDGVPYLPLGRDSVWLDPARIPLAPLERVEVVVLPATLRVYLVTRRQRSTETSSEVGIVSGEVKTANYRGAYLRRWRSGLGLSLVADYNSIDGVFATSSTPFSTVDLWLKAEYVPSPRWGASYAVLSSSWHRTGSDSSGPTPDYRTQRRDGILRLYAAMREDGLGPRAELTLASATATKDSAVPDRSLTQRALTLSDVFGRGAVEVALRSEDTARPWQVAASAAWAPRAAVTLAGDARHAAYSGGRSGNRAHLAAGVAGPLGVTLHGDIAWAHDLQAPVDTADHGQRTVDFAGGVRWDYRGVTLDVGGVSRDPFAPVGWPAGLRGVAALDPTPHARYATAHGAVALLPGLHLAGWYFSPLDHPGPNFEPPHHGRVSITFYSRFWRVYRSGLFALRGEAALESWTHGTAGRASTGPLLLPGASFGELNVELRIAGVTIFWIQRNANGFRGSYVPGLDYPRHFQFYGVRWVFTN